jgi:hypothetical protein
MPEETPVVPFSEVPDSLKLMIMAAFMVRSKIAPVWNVAGFTLNEVMEEARRLNEKMGEDFMNDFGSHREQEVG